MTLPTTTELLLEWNSQRPRSRQAEIGISSLGQCRRRAGYYLAGQEKGRGGSIQAVLGTAIHELAAVAMREAWKNGRFSHSPWIEHEVRFAGVLGHLDLCVLQYEGGAVLRDIKTVGRVQQLDRVKVLGPPRHDLWQVNVYAAGMIVAGVDIGRVEIDYIARDSGETWLFRDEFRVEHVRDAMAWLANVRETPLEYLARDFRPGSPQCESCPFSGPCWEGHVDGRDPLSVLYVDEPDAAKWVTQLEDARRRRREAEDDEKRAKGALDALRPNLSGTADVHVPGADDIDIRFTVSRGRELPDVEQIRADYARGGGRMPVTVGEPSVRVTIVPRKQP